MWTSVNNCNRFSTDRNIVCPLGHNFLGVYGILLTAQLRKIVFLGILLSLASCASDKNVELAERAISEFRSHVSSNKLDAIYVGASDEFRQAGTMEEFVAFLSMVRKKLGAFKSTKEKGWRVTHSTRRTLVTLTYGTQFTNASATENFVYEIRGESVLLVSYRIESELLEGQATYKVSGTIS